MAIKDGLRTLLLAQSSITALAPAQTIGGKSISGIFVDKVYQGFKPPFIRISRTGFDPYKTLDGTVGMRASNIKIECCEYSEPLAEALSVAVSNFLKDYSGAAGGVDTIDAVLWDNVNDDASNENDGGDVWRYIVSLLFTIQHH